MISFFWGGDFRHFYSENISDFINFPFSWDSSLNTGIGQSQIGSLWIISYFNFTLLFSKLGLSWSWISLLFWILPATLLSFLSSSLLFNYLFKDKVKYSLLAGTIYAFNTYFLMILTGGQLGVALSYSLAPLVLLTFMKTFKEPVLKNALVSGLVLGLQTIFDPRIVYVTLIAVFFYLIFDFFKFKTIKDKIILLIPLVIAVLLNAFWILPLLITKNSPIPEGFKSVAGFEFFSFADFSHALSLLHPNWPENIFGKTYFMKPEFILLPMLAYLSLLFLKNSKLQLKSQKKLENNLTIEQWDNRAILFFALLGLLGTFLAKGTNEPFGGVNIWLFKHIPGFTMFRDPTKFYILTALSYSILIPFSLYSAQEWLISKIKYQKSKIQGKYQIFNFSYIVLIFTLLYLIFLIRPLWLGDLNNKFKPRAVPQEYVQLKEFLYNQNEFFRTLWIPQWQRFGYFSNNHPAIGREEILRGDAERQVNELKKTSSEKMLRELSVKYIIVPFDSEGEIFLRDRKYDEKQYKKAIGEMRKIRWLKEIDFGKIAVLEVVNPKDHFWSPSKTLGIEYKFVNPTKYVVQIKNAKKGDLLVFSEAFDEKWFVQNSEFKIQSSKFKNNLNSFILPKDGNYIFKVYYEPQKWVNMGLGISGITLLTIFIILGLGKVISK